MNHAIFISDEDYLQLKSFLPLFGKLIFEIDQARLERQLERDVAEQFRNLKPPSCGTPNNNSDFKTRAETSFFTEEELKKMPRLKDGRTRITPDGYYQIRYRKDGYDKQFTSKSLQVAKDKFREWVKSVNDEKAVKLPKKKQNLKEFAERYFEEVKQQNVARATYTEAHRKLTAYILPALGDLSIKNITPLKCQSLLNGILADGKGRTAEDVKFILGEIFRAAIGEKLITDNPMQFVKIPKHQRKNGKALTLQEIADFIEACKNSPYQRLFMLYLYTGIRRNELHSAKIDDNFITVACGKRRTGQRQQYRKIPIAAGLRQYLPISSEELATANDVLTGNFKKLCPAHHLYDLRHTFTTRAQESGINKTLVDVWTGHKDNRDMTASVYTHFSYEFQLSEIAKLD
ncbi:MAG: site-specific integrase, partial [Clostridia bacterium]|nr:site-specific integrase [Clostridia bacterium]